MADRATVLFAHGARNAEWANPFRRLLAELATLAPGERVELAFLELMSPSLSDCVGGLYADGVREVRVVPVFLGVGGHLKGDLPKIAEELRGRYTGLELSVEPPIGEQPEVISAIARVVARAPR